MYTSTILTGLALAFQAAAIPPPDFGFPEAPNDTALTVTFRQPNGTNLLVSEAELFGINITTQQPTVAVDTAAYASLANYTGRYVVTMVDPDAPSPANPTARFILHWLQPDMLAESNVTVAGAPGSTLVNQSAPFVPYRMPSPPSTSDAHRYIIYAFRQPSNFTIPTAFRGYSSTNRTNFNLTSFIAAAGLGDPAAAQYFYVSNRTGTPGNFTAGPGSTYPGGNGAEVTNGPGPSATPTGATSTSTGAAMMVSAAPIAGLVGLAALFL